MTSKFNYFLKNNSKTTLDNFKLLYNELTLMHQSNFLEKNEEQCKEVIQYIIEYLVYGDKYDSSFFDVFCEYNFMNEFIYLANKNNRQISLQIIKSFSVLILNTTNTTTLYYIFSNNFINQILTNEYEKYDDDFLSYYVNFLKSLSLKIDNTTIQFFFQKQFYSFPLLESSLKLYNHSDPMIKNTVRNILLTILKIKYDPLIDYFSSLPCINYFAFLSCRLRDQITKLNDEIFSDDQQSLKNIHDDMIDDILFFQDIFSLKLERITYILTNCIQYYVILPFLCGALISMTKPRITISVALYVFNSFFYYIKDENFLNCLFLVLFEESITMSLKNYQVEKTRFLKGYFMEWNQQKKSNLKSFTNHIATNFSEPFLKGLVFQTNSPYAEVQAIVKKFDKLTEENFTNNNNSSIDINDYGMFQVLLEDVLSKFSNSEFDVMTIHHQNLSKATGINLGLTTSDIKKSSPLYVLNKMMKILTNVNEDKYNEEVCVNECRGNILSYLKSKDDTLILLVSLLINLVLTKNISKELLSRTRLLPAKFQVRNIKIGNLFEDIFCNIKDNSNNIENQRESNINKNQDDNFDLLGIFEKSSNSANNNIKEDELRLNIENLNIDNNKEYLNQRIFEVKDFSNQKVITEKENNLFVEFNQKNSQNALEVNPEKDLNGQNFDFDFLKTNDKDNINEKKEIYDLQVMSVKGELNGGNKNSYSITQNENIKNADPLDFFNELIKPNKKDLEKEMNAPKNPADYENNSINSNIDDPFKETNYSNNNSNINKNPDNFSYLNFNLENDEDQKLLNSNRIQDSDTFGISGIPGIAEKIIPGISNSENPFNTNSINNIGDINDIFALSEAMDKRNIDEESSNQVLETSIYRKSLENNNLINNKKKIEKLFYTESIIKKFDLKIIQEKYDGELIDILLNLLSIEPTFRTITNRFIYLNLKSLLIKDEDNNNRFNFEKENFIESHHKQYLDCIFLNLLKRIKFYIINNKIIRETGFELFENEWKNYKSDFSITIEDLISKPYLIIPFNLEDIIEDYPKVLRINKNEIEYFRSNLLFYILHSEINFFLDPINNSSISEAFPLKLSGIEIEVENDYDQQLFGGEIYECKMKNNIIRSFQNFQLIIYQNYLIFATVELNNQIKLHIKYKYALRHIEVQFDKSDPRTLNLIAKDKNNYIDLSISFEEINRCGSMKKLIEENRKSAKNTEYLLFDSYFDSLLMKMTY